MLPAGRIKYKTINKKKSRNLIYGNGTILVIEDEKILRKMLKEMLNKIGYEVFLAKDGVEGVELYKKNKRKIDVIILDMKMPRMNGEEALLEIKKINKNAKVILSSGYSENEEMQSIKQIGIDNFLSKPYKINELSEILHKVLG